jgi:hypothetical protein
VTTLIIPGWNGSGPAHWQTLWERAHPEYRRVEQRDWIEVWRGEWLATLDSAVAAARGDIVLVAHSLGSVAVAEWALANPHGATRVMCALLVAPPDLDALPDLPATLASFTPVPRLRLPLRSLLVASENDPYMTAAAAQDLAIAWGSDFFNAGKVGHLNVESGHGPWPEGERMLAELTARAMIESTMP